ncbi:estradiol 17-beta-dehydrogenase 8-like isoform X2 [Pollicipes pollicipes]|nr:estradiol 17-beta-dehydrogenase 8-like [Pollicipes pollicipes]XP_037089192.1 estradiol 17-beta-dehydrogenase 8-like isoform X2 [Pollicipes pollicipes]XP_037089193.1 estradiol 17-beta-dehydrogenase 8-like isoform X2 [Pollicipes pollicipes]XP_037089194.1 estradiol 17-beta-dehydrogenase 8-like isoform X2 [Pollicipes pollicipes]XP_037089195.1 estradiol 17-beta-dehydrogenase 8-like isoform X2 [Pollicipes pollicipes]
MLTGKLALVTGGGSGIGRAVCQVMAREGARIVAADINEASAKETAAMLGGAEHVGVPMDVTSEESVAAVVSGVREKFGSPASCVVNCAGITKDCFLRDMSVETFMQVIDVNLKGTFLITRLTANAMIDAKVGGSIVNIASIVGKGGNIGQCNYTASKAGVEGFTRTAAKELGRKGIRCNAILPGFIDTPMVSYVPDKVMEKLLPLIVLGRPGRPEEVAELAAFLASERASYMTGASVEVTGGYGM